MVGGFRYESCVVTNPKRRRGRFVLIDSRPVLCLRMQTLLAVRYHAINGGGEGGEGVLEKLTSFINHVFDGQDQDLILNGATEDVHQMLREWASSSGSMTIEDFDRYKGRRIVDNRRFISSSRLIC